ncbi:MAG TPA: hypothetical protein VJH89_01425, partial [Patescibacteria group bacterium]|nr:hypothetical protein [Patescibacteria group bacterium]
MWFVSKHSEHKHSTTGTVRFLRKGLPHYRTGRSLTDKQRGHDFSFGIIFLWLMFFATLVYVLFFSLFFLVQTTHIVGVQNITEETVRGFVDQELTGVYLGIFPKRSFFVIRPHFLEER